MINENRKAPCPNESDKNYLSVIWNNPGVPAIISVAGLSLHPYMALVSSNGLNYDISQMSPMFPVECSSHKWSQASSLRRPPNFSKRAVLNVLGDIGGVS